MAEKLRIAMFGNIYQEKKSLAIQKLFSVAQEMGFELAVPRSFHDFVTNRLAINVPACHVFDDDDFEADVVVCLGGDGTFLDVAGRVGKKETPILGINMGRLGFLANFSPDDIDQTMRHLADGNYAVQRHSVIQLACSDLELEPGRCALNEIAILKHDISAMISIHTSINGEYLTTYQGDGLLLSTPTGSTAYSLSVGGPIIVPQLATIALTPVAPHSLNMRPIVVADDSIIDLTVESRSGSFLVSLDGRSHSYRDNIHLRVTKAPYSVNVINRPGTTFFTTLRHKMMWGADIRQ